MVAQEPLELYVQVRILAPQYFWLSQDENKPNPGDRGRVPRQQFQK